MGTLVSRLVFQAPEVSYVHAEKHLVWLKTASGAAIPGFFMDRGSAVTILFSHGNAEDIGMVYEWFREFTKALKVNMFAYDYPGYGKAAGEPSEQACFEAIDAAYEYLTVRRRIHPERIVLYGRSLGSGPSCYLAERLTSSSSSTSTNGTTATSGGDVMLGGLVLQSALLSVYRVAFNFRHSMWGDQFCNIDRIASISCPIFVIHGTRDEIVPFWNGEELFLAAPIQWRACPYWVEKAGHNDVELVQKEDGAFFKRFEAFLREHVPAYAAGEPPADPVISSNSSPSNSSNSSTSSSSSSSNSSGRTSGTSSSPPPLPPPSANTSSSTSTGPRRPPTPSPSPEQQQQAAAADEREFGQSSSSCSLSSSDAEGLGDFASSTHGLLAGASPARGSNSKAGMSSPLTPPTRAGALVLSPGIQQLRKTPSYPTDGSRSNNSISGGMDETSDADTSMDLSTNSFANLLMDEDGDAGPDTERSAGIVGHGAVPREMVFPRLSLAAALSTGTPASAAVLSPVDAPSSSTSSSVAVVAGGGVAAAASPATPMGAHDIHGDEDVHDEFEELYVGQETTNTL